MSYLAFNFGQEKLRTFIAGVNARQATKAKKREAKSAGRQRHDHPGGPKNRGHLLRQVREPLDNLDQGFTQTRAKESRKFPTPANHMKR